MLQKTHDAVPTASTRVRQGSSIRAEKTLKGLAALLLACGLNTTGTALASDSTTTASTGGSGKVTLIHTGDIHGHLVPRANVRSDSIANSKEGGVARMATIIKAMRKEATVDKVDTSLLINTGDTLQGSGEAMFTRGQAMIDVVNLLGVTAHAPGNWDFLYGPARFEETFKGTATTKPLANWNALSANLYYTNQFDNTTTCGVQGTDPATGTLRNRTRVLPPYMIKQVGKVKVGILGFTTARAIAAISPLVTANYQFTDAKTELPCYITQLRTVDKVDLVVMISELEMSRDIALAEAYPGVDIILNSDMHERTMEPIIASTGTIIVEEGQDGTMIGNFELEIKDGKLVEWEWYAKIITEDIVEDPKVAAKIALVRAPFVSGTFVPGQQVTIGGNTTTLLRPVDEVLAYTQVALHRSNFMDEAMPGVVEGSSHNLIADAMRWSGGTDAAALRGFRYGTHIPVGGAITMADIYHYIPIAAKLGKSTKACGGDLKTQVEQSTQGSFSPDPTLWAGGWMFGYSNVSFDLDACAGFGITGITQTDRGTNIKVGGVAINTTDAYDGVTTSPTYQMCKSGTQPYSVAGYWFADDPTTINNCNPCRGRLIQVVSNTGTAVTVAGPGVTGTLPDSNSLLDVTEAVVNYLRAPASAGGIGGMVTADNLKLNRLTIKRLPNINPYAFKTVQPLRGATAATCPAL